MPSAFDEAILVTMRITHIGSFHNDFIHGTVLTAGVPCSLTITRLLLKWFPLTPGPWLVHFFRSGKNPQEPNLQH